MCPFKNGIGSLYRYEKQKNFLSLNMCSLKIIEYEAVFISKILFIVQIQLCLLVIQSCPFVFQLCLLVIQLLYLIMPAWNPVMLDIIFQLLLFVIKLSRSFSRLIIAVCHAISYFMNFIELRLVAIQLFNIDSISIDCLYLSPQKHRCILTEVFAQASSRLSCTRFENGVEGNSGCKRFRRKKRKLSTSINIVERSDGYPEVTMHVFLSFS